MVVFGQKLLYSSNGGCIREKVVVFGQICCIRTRVVVFGHGGCIRTKVVVFEQKWKKLSYFINMADERVSDVSFVSDRRSLQRSISLPSLQRSISLLSLPCFDIGSGERFRDKSLSVDLSASMVSKSTRPMLKSKSPSRRPDEGGLINIENASSILIGNRELESLKSKELKRELIARNLDSSGKKSAIVDRLRKFIQNSRQNQTLDGNRNHAME